MPLSQMPPQIPDEMGAQAAPSGLPSASQSASRRQSAQMKSFAQTLLPAVVRKQTPLPLLHAAR
jgi:hypothetical protein